MKILLVAVIIVAVSIVLCRLADDRTNTRTRGARNQRTFDSTAEHCAQRGSGCAPYQRTFARTDTALVSIFIVVTISMVIITATIVPPAAAALGSIVEAVIVAPILGEDWHSTTKNRTK
jgi:hypothetical protein